MTAALQRVVSLQRTLSPFPRLLRSRAFVVSASSSFSSMPASSERPTSLFALTAATCRPVHYSHRSLHTSAPVQNLLGDALGSSGSGGGSGGGLGGAQERLPFNTGICIVPQMSAWVVERFGKFHRVLNPGLNFLIPLVDRIRYVHSLKEGSISVPNQMAITADNVSISVDGVLYIKIMNAELASYGHDDAIFAVTQLAQTTMRSELGKLTLDKTFSEREHLNANIVETIDKAAMAWGIKCLRYEIRDIAPPRGVRAAMELQAEAERKKRANILDSEGARDSEVNVAMGKKQAEVLVAQADSEAMLLRAEAAAKCITLLATEINKQGGSEAVSLRIAEQYLSAFGNLAQKSTTVVLPADLQNPSSMIASAMAVFNSTQNKKAADGGAGSSGGSGSALRLAVAESAKKGTA